MLPFVPSTLPAMASFPATSPSVSALEGYLMSSMELRSGLQVREVRVSALPLEIARELARLRRTWAGGQGD